MHEVEKVDDLFAMHKYDAINVRTAFYYQCKVYP